MWEHIVIGAVVALAAIYVLRRLRRTLSGKTACEQGICEGCSLADNCSDPSNPHDHPVDSE